MKRTLLFALALAAWSTSALALLPPPLAKAFRSAGVPPEAVALVVQETGTVQPLIAHASSKPMSPASLMKLIATFAALELLGPEYRWTTEAYLDGKLENGVLHGNLVLKGHGDPRITVEQWQSFMSALTLRGLTTIEGDLVLDRSFFSPIVHDPGLFDGEPLNPYNVGPDALLVNFKSMRFAFAPNRAGNGTDVIANPAFANVTIAPLPELAAGGSGAGGGTGGARAATGAARSARRSSIAETAPKRGSPDATPRPAASTNGGSRCSTTAPMCTRCSRRTCARRAD